VKNCGAAVISLASSSRDEIIGGYENTHCLSLPVEASEGCEENHLPRHCDDPSHPGAHGFSPASNHAAAYARDLAKQNKAELVLVHVILPAGSPDLIYGSILWDQETMTNAARSALQKWQTEAGLGRVQKIKRQVRVGVPYMEIVEAARETKSDLIVIPTHGHTGLKHYLLGGTAERVVRHAGCPVLVVRAG